MKWEYNSPEPVEISDNAWKWEQSRLVTTLLLNRGFQKEENVREFIHPTEADFFDPFAFEMMRPAIALIDRTIKNKEKIFVYGDYDVDGITSTAFLVLVLRDLGAEVDYYIPRRMEESYGLDRKTIDFIHERDGKLIITVDTGYNKIEDVAYARSLGLDIIVTDHHMAVRDKADDSVLVINPKMSESYPFKFLSGAGVVLKLAQGICKTFGLPVENIYRYMDIVMIGTVADVVPMVSENRIIIKEGLRRIRETKIKGLTYLMRYLRLTDKAVTTTDVSYFISPLINSLGRIGDSKMGADFFTEDDDFAIYNIIEEMKKNNKIRRELEKKIYEDAIREVSKRSRDSIKSLFLYSEKWHPGVIGVVSSRLSIKYNVPVTLIAVKNGFGKASCRSINGISIFNIFENMKESLIRFGGHDLASGFVVEQKKIPEIAREYQEVIDNMDVRKEEMVLRIDAEFPVENVSDELFTELECIAPFGLGNPNPLFLDRGVTIINVKKFGVGDRHFNGMILKNDRTYHMVAFELGHKIDGDRIENQKVDIVYYPEKTMFRGENIIQIRVRDLKIVE
ncbi:MAG: single-stranded-DNA-specific exonuclease RecJ [Fusobacteriaceae bacterium]|jgi:single-stranded-DNA-specific exonuclease|nr:single-stranded-DNA-specific exonuclease RecJ [Fusobacteriaceae bacterium]